MHADALHPIGHLRNSRANLDERGKSYEILVFTIFVYWCSVGKYAGTRRLCYGSKAADTVSA